MKILAKRMDCNQSRMFPTLATLNAPKSATPDFGVKPGNDGGNRGTSVPHPFDRDLLLVAAAPRPVPPQSVVHLHAPAYACAGIIVIGGGLPPWHIAILVRAEPPG